MMGPHLPPSVSPCLSVSLSLATPPRPPAYPLFPQLINRSLAVPAYGRAQLGLSSSQLRVRE